MDAYWTRRQLSVGRPDLSLRQSAAKAAAETVAREAAGGRTLGTTPGQNFIYVHFEPGHQEVTWICFYIAGPVTAARRLWAMFTSKDLE